MGTSLALHLAEKGVDVSLLEAVDIGFGASGRNGGSVATHSESTLLPIKAIRRLPEAGERYLEMIRQGPGVVQALIKKNGISSSYRATGHLSFARTQRAVRELAEHGEFFNKLNLPMSFLSRQEIAGAVGTDCFHAALKQPSGGIINSFAYTNGLARAASNAGARIHCHTVVQSIEQKENKWKVISQEGSVLADIVCLCTNAYSADLVSGLSRSFYRFLLATIGLKPLPEEIHRAVNPCGASLYEVGTPAAIQKDVTGRFYFSSATSPFRPQRQGLYKEILISWLHRTFPSLRQASLEVEHYWTGVDAFTLDGLPRIYNPAPGIYAPMCFNGLGITTCTQFGVALANAIAKQDFRDLPVPLSQPRQLICRDVFRLAAGMYVTHQLKRSIA